MNSKQRSFLLRLSAIAIIFGVILLSTKVFALDNVGKNIISPAIAEGFDIGKFVGIVIGGVLALIGMLLWLVTRFLVFVFQLVGGIVYGFFINNPLDTELGYIRPLWSFLVDFGNLVVIGSFIALALVYLFDIKLQVENNLGKFAGGIVMIALLLNFSLTLTSAFASTVHSIGIGTVYATQSNIGTNLDLSSRNAFNKSVAKTGNSFFTAVTNNFVENVSCFGNKITEYKTGAEGKSETKSMASVCQFHKKDNGEQLNGLTIISASDGTPEAFTFYMILIIRELMVLILLSVGIFVLIKLLKVAVFRLAYLWIVGIFAGPALVAAFSPFTGMQNYFKIWLKWLVVFSTMMIVFVAGFYLSSYIATINIPSTAVSYEPLINPLESPGLFVSQLVNSIIEIVVPNVMFPIIGLVIMFLLGKYLDETYQEQAEKAMKAGGKLLNDARSSVTSAGKFAVAGTKGLSNLGLNVRDKYNTGALKTNSVLAASQRLIGNEAGAKSFDARATKFAGRAAVNKQMIANKNAAVDDFISGKNYKAKRAEVEYLGKQNNAEVLGRLGADTGAFANEAKKAGVSDNVINAGKTAAYKLKNDQVGGGKSLKERVNKIEGDTARVENKEFETQFGITQSALKTAALEQKDKAEKDYGKNLGELTRQNASEALDIDNKRKAINNSSTLNASEREKQLASLDTRQSKIDAKEAQLLQIKKDALADIDKMIVKIDENISTNTIVTDTVNQKYIADNPEVRKKVANQINKVESRAINNTSAIAGRNKAAKDQYDQIDGQANAIFQQLLAIDQIDDISGNEKKSRREALLSTVSGSKQEVKKVAERKYRENNSNLYGDE
jgi:hypothetical protein